jgi:hypothetical protein
MNMESNSVTEEESRCLEDRTVSITFQCECHPKDIFNAAECRLSSSLLQGVGTFKDESCHVGKSKGRISLLVCAEMAVSEKGLY